MTAAEPALRRQWQWLAMALLLGTLVWLLAPILTPFVLAALLAWLGDPLVARLERAGRSRGTAVVLVFGLMSLAVLLGLLLLLPLVEAQVHRFVLWLPRFAAWLTGTAVPWAEQRFGLELAGYVDPTQLVALIKQHWQQAGGIAATVMGGLSKSGLAVVLWITNLALLPVLTFYFLRDWRPMLARVRELLPRPLEPTLVDLARQSDDVLGAFLRGQLSVMLALGVIYASGLWLVGVDLGILIGLIAGLVSFVPYLGAIIGIGAGVIATLVQHGDLTHLLLVLAVFVVGQTLESFVLTPWLVGDRIGLHPVAVIFAIMAGGQLFGFLGVLLALPVAAVIRVLLAWMHARYLASHAYGAAEGAVPGTMAAEQGSEPDAAVAARGDDIERPDV